MGSTSLLLFSCPNLLVVFPNSLKELYYIFSVSFELSLRSFILSVPYFGKACDQRNEGTG